jgi:WD40 repeat protein
MASEVDYRYRSGHTDGVVALWNTHGWLCRRTLKQHWSGITGIDFSPDGRLLADASWDRTVKLWDVTSSRVLQTQRVQYHGFSSVAFSPNGKLLAASLHRGGVRLWDRTTGRKLSLHITRQ